MNPNSQVKQAIQSIPWFQGIKPQYFDRLAEIAQVMYLSGGEELFSEGDKEKNIYVLLDGRIALEMFIPHRGRARILTVEPVELFGWSSVTPVVRQRTTNARAITDSRLIAINTDQLSKLCNEDHDLGYIIMRHIANIIASRLMVTRLQLLDIFSHPADTIHIE